MLHSRSETLKPAFFLQTAAADLLKLHFQIISKFPSTLS